MFKNGGLGTDDKTIGTVDQINIPYQLKSPEKTFLVYLFIKMMFSW